VQLSGFMHTCGHSWIGYKSKRCPRCKSEVNIMDFNRKRLDKIHENIKDKNVRKMKELINSKERTTKLCSEE